MAWPFDSSQTNPKPNARKRVSFSPGQPTGCPPAPPPGAKGIRFTSDTKKGSRSDTRSAGGSSKTRWPSPPKAAGLSSVKRDFQTRKTEPALKPALKKSSRDRGPTPPKSSRALPRAARPDAIVSIPVGGKSYDGPPKARHQRPGFEWVSHEIRVKATIKDWRREGWAR